MAAKIAINGFGRIGRTLARLILSQNQYDLVAINDPCDLDTSAYLLKYDSVHGKTDINIQTEDNHIFADAKRIRYSSNENTKDNNFEDCDIVFECSGKYTTTDSLQCHLAKGIKSIIISSMPKDETPVFVNGISDKKILLNNIISAGSCSTNALALILSSIEEKYKINFGSVTSIHSYTSDQNILDGRNEKCLRTSRAAAINIIPTPTGVANNLLFIMPHLASKFIGFSVRVPVSDITMLDITVSLQNIATIDEINEIFVKKSKNELNSILEVDHNSRVSSDFISNSSTVSVAIDLTQKIDKNNFKIVAWLDNEFGYAHRLYDLIKLLKETH